MTPIGLGREAFWHGYKVIFGSDINSTDDPVIQDAELRTLRRGFARVMSADEIIHDVKATSPAPAELQPAGA